MIRYKRNGETRTVSRRNEIRLQDAITKVSQHGYVRHNVGQDALSENPLVVILQEWSPRGKEEAVFIKSRGKYSGNSIGTSRRADGWEHV